MKGRRVLLAVLTAGFLLVCVQKSRTFLAPIWSMDQNPGTFKRKTFAAIVDKVREVTPTETEEIRFYLEDLSSPESLRSLDSEERFMRGEKAGLVWASKSSSGDLKVVIQTKDLGHAGEYGFAYSDTPLNLTSFEKPWFFIDVPGRLNIVTPKMQIDKNWWKVVYNLG